MTSTNPLEFKGNILRHPVAELIVEFSDKELSGSLRLSDGDKKTVVYFEQGKVIFAVSNSRSHRLYEILLAQNQIQKSQLAQIEEFTNDFHLAHSLVKNGVFVKEGIDAIFGFQISKILSEALEWNAGEFVFSASARIKAGINFDVDMDTLLLSQLEKIDALSMTERFSSLEEGFVLKSGIDIGLMELKPEEAFLLSRLGVQPVSADNLRAMCGLPSSQLLPILYKFWFKGLVSRSGWAQAIDSENTSKISETKFELKQSALSYEEEREKAAKAAEEAAIKEADQKKMEEELLAESNREQTLEEYLTAIDNAATHYELFDVSPDAKLTAIKKSYFSLAKRFHPDLFHRQVDKNTHTRIQGAFTEIAQAYETLKNEESREVYDFKLRKVIEQLREAEAGEQIGLTREDMAISGQAGKALENFGTGYDYLLKDKIDDCLPYLARAAHLEPDNARYHAFYGRALTFDKDNRRKAEAELQLAIKIEPDNPQYKFMLAEVFVEIGLIVRAKGELTRLLENNPNYREAAALLDTL